MIGTALLPVLVFVDQLRKIQARGKLVCLQARALALEASEVQRAHHELRIPPSRVGAQTPTLLVQAVLSAS